MINYKENLKRAIALKNSGAPGLVIHDYDSWRYRWECWIHILRCLAYVKGWKKSKIAKLYIDFESITNGSMNSFGGDSFAASIKGRFELQKEESVVPTKKFIVDLAAGLYDEQLPSELRGNGMCPIATDVIQGFSDDGATQMILSQGWIDYIKATPVGQIDYIHANRGVYGPNGELIGIQEGPLAHSMNKDLTTGKVGFLMQLAKTGFFKPFEYIIMFGDGSSDLDTIMNLPKIAPHAVVAGVSTQISPEIGSRDSVIKKAIKYQVPVAMSRHDFVRLGILNRIPARMKMNK